MNIDIEKIQKRAFFSAIIILFTLLIFTGIMTYFIPSGSYDYIDVDGIKTVVPNSFRFTNLENLPWYRIFTAPFEVLVSDGNVIVIAIIIFLLIIGGSIHLLNHLGVINYMILSIVDRYKNNRYLLLSIITFIFMSIGAFIGVFEEIIPLVPIMIVLSKKLGWDTKTGLGMSILATGFGFSAAISNPFTIGVAQGLAELPLFSGYLYRIIIFLIIYLLLLVFLITHARKADVGITENISVQYDKTPSKGSLIWFIFIFSFMMIGIFLSPFITFFQDYNLILIALYFLVASIGCGILNKMSISSLLKIYGKGSLGLSPGIILILLATGVKQVIVNANILDTILYYVVSGLENSSSMVVVIGAFLFTLIANFFIGSGSAKAFLIMPLLNPLFDLSNISRQLGVLAFQLGDGFSNMFYPTNAVLLVALGLANFSYIKWFKWTWLLQLVVIVLSILFLYIGLKVGY